MKLCFKYYWFLFSGHGVVVALHHVCFQSHDDLRRAYEARLASLGVGPEETGFVPVVCRLRTIQLGKGPAGLTSIQM